MRRGGSEGESARAVDGVDAALRPLTLVFKASSDGRDEAGVGECALDEAIEGRGEDMVDMLCLGEEESGSCRQIGYKRWSVLWGSRRFFCSFLFSLIFSDLARHNG